MSDDITTEQLLALLDNEPIDLTAYLDTEPIDLSLYLDTKPEITGLTYFFCMVCLPPLYLSSLSPRNALTPTRSKHG